ncbi:MAG: hypothetical protein HZA19_04895 [Nitrospirae bacterium]|nr:hypothetical protein [Nitrospirota bacterium]
MFEHRSVWWKSEIRFEQERLIPIGSFTEYDPFAWYFPREKSTRLNRSLPYLFLDVDANEPLEVISFCERFGVLGDDGTFFKWILDTSGMTFKVGGKSITYEEWLRSNTPPTQEQRDYWEKEILGLLAGKRPDPTLCVPLTIAEFREAQKQLRETIDSLDLIRDPKMSAIEKKAIQIKLAWFFFVRLGFVRPALSWNEQAARWVTGWDIGSLHAAIYLMVLFDAQGGGRILTCPRCHKVFLGDRPKTRFCSPRCMNQDKQKRFREQHRQPQVKAKKGGSGHGAKRR